jgi:hypothetical protein
MGCRLAGNTLGQGATFIVTIPQVWDNQRDILAREALSGKNFSGNVSHLGNRGLEDISAVLKSEMLPVFNSFMTRWPSASPGFHVQVRFSGTVDVQDEIKDAVSGFAARIEKPSPGAVTEKNAGVSVSVVDDCAHYVAAADEDFIDPSGLAILDFAQATRIGHIPYGMNYCQLSMKQTQDTCNDQVERYNIIQEPGHD